ncbi:hypothetical protein [Streptomyces musisoli]|uniref:hypothetical protein n=1 Tax=Streptomyces musisoli TaxID=2802280 RepID=UPI0027DA4ABB|nr:hypothetical protein [Streptomyces musisoli]
MQDFSIPHSFNADLRFYDSAAWIKGWKIIIRFEDGWNWPVEPRIERMTDSVPSRLDLLRFARRVVEQQTVAALDGWIAEKECRETERQRGESARSPAPDWLIQHGLNRMCRLMPSRVSPSVVRSARLGRGEEDGCGGPCPTGIAARARRLEHGRGARTAVMDHLGGLSGRH